MPRSKPKPRARGLAEGLRAERRACKLAMVEVAAKLGWSEATLSRMETGLRNASSEEVAALLAVYQVTGARRTKLLEMSREADRPAWLEMHSADVPEQAKVLARYEAEAVRIVESAVNSIPVLLQTSGYAGSLPGVPNLRPERQSVLDRRSVPMLLAYVDEAALHRVVGGPRLMAHQLRQLAAMTERAQVEARVVPFGAGRHPAGFELLDFADAGPLVYVEQPGSGLLLDQAAHVEPYVRAVATLDSVALDPTRSRRLIEQLAARYESVVEARPQVGDFPGQQARLAGQHGDVPVVR
ncbi:transcriptional regulator with XRE-family HTH domain [Amycolatopsis lexingtonensis]|uniref:Transcriptional regulator with XRE-family HTH domain n=1 Tax=Amycolatopsis lexingtonensis TaxID=218822 RepID=A0ABR9I7B7_9PSEU|nr:helix-turn-helix transcriptional regulator [Amycolatopsis lexingtonensis]MBE1499093.1 transcriptional regulator with XRE-family HTH domain [Amycolatopsis lexingtonensis]